MMGFYDVECLVHGTRKFCTLNAEILSSDQLSEDLKVRKDANNMN